MEPFRFKQFSVAHDRSAHKVGTDAVLLGSWVDIAATDRNILDIGTGSGVIALMLAQRTSDTAHIDALELHEQDAEQARENVARSPWPQKVSVHTIAAQNFNAEKSYDLIVSNPPFFVKSLQPPDQRRMQARHTLELSFDDLLLIVGRLLSPGGKFAVILPHTEGLQFIARAKHLKLHALRVTSFRTRAHKPVERLLMEFSQQEKPTTESEVILYADKDQWSDAYQSLTGNFYIRQGQ